MTAVRVKPLFVLESLPEAIRTLDFSNDGRHLVSGDRTGTVVVWDIESRAKYRAFNHAIFSDVHSVIFLPNDKSVASAGVNMKIKLWDIRAGRCVKTLGNTIFSKNKGHTGSISSIASSPGVNHIISGSSDGTIRIWDLNIGSCITTISYHRLVSAVAVSPNGAFIAGGDQGHSSHNGNIRIWTIEKCVELGTLSLDERCGRIEHLSFSPDERFLGAAYAYCGGYANAYLNDNVVRIWDWRAAKCVNTLAGHSSYLNSCALSPDGSLIASASSDATVKIWDWQTGKCIRTLADHTGGVNSAVFSACGRYIASAGQDKSIRIYSARL